MKCKEVAIFKFKVKCIDGSMELNKNLMPVMQSASNGSLLNYEVYQSPKKTCCFNLVNRLGGSNSAKETADNWMSFPCNQKFSSSVEQNVFL